MSRIAAFAALVALTGGAALYASSSVQKPAAAPSDLDAFMQKVLARRDDNWKKLQQYILTEKQLIDFRGLDGVPIWGDTREFSWFLKDGYFVRSPTKVNGVTVSESDRRKYEADYLKKQQEREKRSQAKTARGSAPADKAGTPAEQPAVPAEQANPTTDVDSLIKQTREPEFISSAYFLRFKFEQGKYALVGKETQAGRETLRIEYYPARLFSHEQDRQQQRSARGSSDKEKDMDAAIETAMNKVSLVTIWVDPKSSQIVKYTFDNVNLDFLPGSTLVRVDDLRASMTMSQPYPDVWLPHDVEFHAGAMLAVGQFNMKFRVDYTDYKLAETSVRIKTPNAPLGAPGGGAR